MNQGLLGKGSLAQALNEPMDHGRKLCSRRDGGLQDDRVRCDACILFICVVDSICIDVYISLVDDRASSKTMLEREINVAEFVAV
jgi:hypothetical protein